MEQLLVVVEPTEPSRELVHEAGEVAEAVGAEVLLIHITTALEYSTRRKAREEPLSSTETYTREEAKEGATRIAREMGDDVLSEFDVEYEASGYLGDRAETILEVADQHDCDHVFLTGRQRSPAGKAIFGDATQKVVLNFDGLVTVSTN
ncbi:universal stress protein [Halocatena salina]|uniref:Universal stress protein n=1 Tax=Halocatena salina TaxID=2934340 RepID=A0A8U0A6D5_9EURY|nr:universal stress protein [Halocatena salina]UPM44436.1 universal stress protein [Halocatena salina]